MSEFTFEVIEEIAELSVSNNGWAKMLTRVSWNGRPPVYDIRSWDETMERCGKGITLTDKEFEVLKSAILEGSENTDSYEEDDYGDTYESDEDIM